MTHRSPLVTLAGLVVAFAIFFGANLANSAPGQAPGPGYSSASASASSQDETPSSPATTQQASPTASQRATSSPTRCSTPAAPTTTARRLRWPCSAIGLPRTCATVATLNPGCAAAHEMAN